MATKAELIENGETLEAESGSSTAYASKNALDWTGESVIGGDYGVSYHQGAMPAHGSQNFAMLDGLLAKMREIAPLSKWRISRPD